MHRGRAGGMTWEVENEREREREGEREREREKGRERGRGGGGGGLFHQRPFAGYTDPLLEAVTSFLEPFCGHVSHKLTKSSKNDF